MAQQPYRVPPEYIGDYPPQENEQRALEAHTHQQLQHASATGFELDLTPHSGRLQTHMGYGTSPIQHTQPHLQYGNPAMPAVPGPVSKRRTHEEMEMGMGQLGHDDGLPDMSQGIGGYRTEHQQYHSHPLPESAPKRLKQGDSGDSGMISPNTVSVIGQPGMPPPAMKPRGPKLKFTPEDDQLLVDLKENKSLTWKQIAEFFPGRSSGTLQVRYCTKLKAKTTQWTDETVQKLRTALQDYEQEKWRIIANKVGAGFTPAACREKAREL